MPNVTVKHDVSDDMISNSSYVASLQILAPPVYKLGSARIFVSPAELSGEMVDHLKEFQALKDLHVEVYLQGMKSEDLSETLRKLFIDPSHPYPADLQFNIDLNDALANELQVKGKNVVVYTNPKGQTQQFELNSTYATRIAIERIKQGAVTN